MFGINIIGLFGFNFAMQFPGNEILIGLTLAVTGGARGIIYVVIHG